MAKIWDNKKNKGKSIHSKTNKKNSALPEIEDPTDRRIWELIEKDPSLIDRDIGQKFGLSRQTVNRRRGTLIKMGYPAQKVSRQKRAGVKTK
jgi:predicted transcriptional regulator